MNYFRITNNRAKYIEVQSGFFYKNMFGKEEGNRVTSEREVLAIISLNDSIGTHMLFETRAALEIFQEKVASMTFPNDPSKYGDV